jgi:hypothetical protein
MEPLTEPTADIAGVIGGDTTSIFLTGGRGGGGPRRRRQGAPGKHRS